MTSQCLRCTSKLWIKQHSCLDHRVILRSYNSCNIYSSLSSDILGTLRSEDGGCLRRLSWPRGGLGRGCRRKARKILKVLRVLKVKGPSRRRGRYCLHIFDFYHKFLQSWLPLERFVAFFCKVLMMAIYQRTSSFFFMALTYPKTQIFLMKFRFRKSDPPVLSEALHLPNYLTCQQGTICNGIEGLCIAFRRFAQWFNSTIRPPSSSAKYDFQPCGGYNLSGS